MATAASLSLMAAHDVVLASTRGNSPDPSGNPLLNILRHAAAGIAAAAAVLCLITPRWRMGPLRLPVVSLSLGTVCASGIAIKAVHLSRNMNEAMQIARFCQWTMCLGIAFLGFGATLLARQFTPRRLGTAILMIIILATASRCVAWIPWSAEYAKTRIINELRNSPIRNALYIASAAILAGTGVALLVLAKKRPWTRGKCLRCGYAQRELPICPECGFSGRPSKTIIVDRGMLS